MIDHFSEALKYLASPAGSFWKWDDQGAVVIWKNGSTIAFREELSVVLSRLAPKGLPAFDAVLLLIAATRAYWKDDSHAFPSQVDQHIPPFVSAGFRELRNQLLERLSEIHELPDELIRSSESKAELAAFVFEFAPRFTTSDTAQVICEILEKRLNHLPDLPKLRRSRSLTTSSLLNDLSPFKEGLERASKVSLWQWRKTGLEVPPVPAPIEFPVEQSAMRLLLAQLAIDEELGGLSRLTRNLSAVIQLPRAISDSNELPLGGVSDLTNRGTLDRLLLSELAHDDLMLATRVALNEALYLRREMPPSFPPQHRHILIDAGIRMWGVPRVFSTAVAMSFVATLGQDAILTAFRASGETVVPIDFSTVDGISDHLAALEIEAHPGSSFTSFFQRLHQTERDGDAILITTEATLADPALRQCFAKDSRFSYIATVNREGDFQLWATGSGGRKILSTLRLDLDELLKPPASGASSRRAKSQLIDPTVDPNLPAIFRQKLAPLRLPYGHSPYFRKEVVWSLTQQEPFTTRTEITPRFARPNRTVFVMTRDHRLLMFDQRSRAGIQLGNRHPFGRFLCAWPGDLESESFLLIYRESDRSLHLFSIDAAHQTVHVEVLKSVHATTSGPGSTVHGATVHGSVIFVIFSTWIEAFDISTRKLLDFTYSELPHGWRRNRYFFNTAMCHGDAWYALSFNGTNIQFEPVPTAKFRQNRNIVSIFELEGCDGPFAISEDGIVFSLSEHTPPSLFWKFSLVNFHVLDIDRDGSRALIQFSQSMTAKPETHVLQMKPCKTTEVEDLNSLAVLDALNTDMGETPIRKLKGISLSGGQFTLIGRDFLGWQFSVKSDRLVMTQIRRIPDQPVCEFQIVANSNHPGFPGSLRLAEWKDGSRVWLDSRGLIHLKSSDASIPETTLLLDPKDVAVWTSDGQVLGSSYYVDQSDSMMKPQEVIDLILKRFVACLRS